MILLQPDVAAPGLNILAAWSPAAKQMNFNVLSGTSMACPHVTGVAALIKAVHPSWSPSAIKSAIMTTGETPPPGSRKIVSFFFLFLFIILAHSLVLAFFF